MMTTESRLVVDRAGNLLVAAGENNRIRVVATRSGTFYGQRMTVGHIYTVAGGGQFPFGGDGGPATRAELFAPTGVAVNALGDLLVADRYRVQMISG